MSIQRQAQNPGQELQHEPTVRYRLPTQKRASVQAKKEVSLPIGRDVAVTLVAFALLIGAILFLRFRGI